MSTISTSRRLSFFVLLIAILLVAALLRLRSLQEPVWLDELHTSWCVSSGLDDVASRSMLGNQTPLYFWLVCPVYQGLGETAFALRLVSLIASLLLLVSIGWIVFQWTGSIIGTALAMALATIDDKFLFYAVEARPYVLVQLAAVWQVTFLVDLLFPCPTEDSRGDKARFSWTLAGFWLLTNALMWLHPTTFVLLMAELTVFLALSVSKKGNIDTPLLSRHFHLVSLLGILGLVFPLIVTWFMWRLRGSWDVMIDPREYALLSIADWVVCLATPALALLLFGKKQTANWQWIATLTAIAAAATIAVLIASWRGWVPLAEYRFTISAATLVVLIAGSLTGILKRIRIQVLAATVVMGLAITTNPLLPGWVRFGTMPSQRVEQWKEIVDILNSDRLPICMYPNLVEDAQLDKLAANLHYLLQPEYFQFPIRGLYSVKGVERKPEQVEAVSLKTHQMPSHETIARFEKARGGWILIRALPSDAYHVIEKLPLSFGAKWRFEFEDFSLPPLYMYRICLVPANEMEAVSDADNQ